MLIQKEDSLNSTMRKEEDTIALLESHALGNVDFDTLDRALSQTEVFADTQEAVALFQAALEVIELSGLRQTLQQIAREES